MPQLNIKNERAHELAERLAQVTGKSMSAVVVEAMEEKLRREETTLDRSGVAERLLELGREVAARPALDPRPIQEIMDDLYDEDGLPK